MLTSGVLAALCVGGGGLKLPEPELVVADPTALAEQEARAHQLSEIVVTGERSIGAGHEATRGRVGVLGDLDVLDAPFSLRSVTDELIANRQAQNFTRAVESDPSISQTGGASRNSTWTEYVLVRGFAGYPSDGAAINGLFGLTGYTPSVDALARIDILKGPTAFLTGAPGAVGGSFNFLPKRADNAPNRALTAEYASDSVFGLTLDLGQRFDDGRFGARFNGAVRQGDFAIDGASRKDGNAAMGLDYRGQRLSTTLDVIYERTRNDGYQYSVSLGPTYPFSAPFPRPIDGRRRTQPDWMNAVYNNVVAVARADLELAPGWTASGAFGARRRSGGYQSYCTITLVNEAGLSECNVFGYFATDYGRSADLTVAGEFATGPLRHRLVFGGNRIENDNEATGSIVFPAYTVANGGAFNFYDSDDRPPRPTFPARPEQKLLSERRITGVFVGDTISLPNDVVTLTVGARRTAIATDSFDRAGTRTSRSDEAAVTPAIAATIQPTEWLTVYANTMEALEPGGIAPATATNAGQAFPPLKSEQVEAGVKARLGPLFATAAAFRIRKGNQYLDAVTRAYVQDGRQTNEGIELSLVGETLPGLNVSVAATWIDAVQDKTSGGVFDGKQASAVPELNGRLSLDYALPALPDLVLTAAVVHAGEAAFDNANTRTVPSWTRYDIGARYAFRAAGRDFVARALVENVANEAYYTAAFNNALNVGTPRTVALSLSARF